MLSLGCVFFILGSHGRHHVTPVYTAQQIYKLDYQISLIFKEYASRQRLFTRQTEKLSGGWQYLKCHLNDVLRVGRVAQDSQADHVLAEVDTAVVVLWKEGRNQLAGPLVELLLITAPKVKPRHVTWLNVITLWACLEKTLHWEQTASQGSTCSQFRRKKDRFLLTNEQKHLDPGDPELIYIPQEVFHDGNEEGTDDSKSGWPKAGFPTHEPLT